VIKNNLEVYLKKTNIEDLEILSKLNNNCKRSKSNFRNGYFTNTANKSYYKIPSFQDPSFSFGKKTFQADNDDNFMNDIMNHSY
jgi:hypothetical protein